MRFPHLNKLGLSRPPSGFGLDISSSAIRIVQLSGRGQGISCDVCIEEPVPKGLIANGEINNLDDLSRLVSKALHPYLSQLSTNVVACLPESKTFLQLIAIEKTEGATLAARLAEVLPEYLPMAQEEMSIDSAIVSETPAEWHVEVGAAPRAHVENFLRLFQNLQLVPIVFDLEALAITRAVLGESLPPHPVAILDLGSSHASLIVVDTGTVRFTVSMPIAGKALTQSIATSLDLTEEQAEKAKLTCGLHRERCDGVVLALLDDMVRDLGKHIIDARNYYEDHFVDARPLKEILLCGGGAHMLGIHEALSTACGLPVTSAEPWNIVSTPAERPTTTPLSYTTALGLALRAHRHVV